MVLNGGNVDIEKHYTAICISVAALLAIGVWFYGACLNDVSDIGERTNRVREQLSDAGESQSRTAESLDRANDLAGSAEGRAEKIERGNQQLQSSERRDEEIVGECQCILDQVRERGKAQN